MSQFSGHIFAHNVASMPPTPPLASIHNSLINYPSVVTFPPTSGIYNPATGTYVAVTARTIPARAADHRVGRRRIMGGVDQRTLWG